MLAYQQQYQPGMQRAQRDVQQYNVQMRQAEENRKAEIARRAAEAAAAAEAARLAEEERLRQEQAAQSSGNGDQFAGASGGLASLRGFE
jgi:hypothetical protein